MEDSSREKCLGALFGLAVGDAVGTTLEFQKISEGTPLLTDMIGGGRFSLLPGQWTDGTQKFDLFSFILRSIRWKMRLIRF
jgi:ADP-ribosyl-[dinitrogen reductase] hydrolase